MLVRILDQDSHPVVAVVILGGAQYPDAGPVHLHDGVHPLPRTEGQDFHRLRRGHRVPIQGHNVKQVARQGNAPVSGGAGVEHVHQQALARPDANRFTRAERLVIDGENPVADFQTVLPLVGDCRPFGLRSDGSHFHFIHIFRGQERFPFAQSQKYFLVVAARIVGRLDKDETELPRVCATVQIDAGHRMGVIPARSRGPRHKLVPAAAMGRDHRCAFLLRAVNIRRDEESMPVYKFGHVGFVHDIHGHRFALPHSQDGTRRGAVIADRADGAIRIELHNHGGDFESDIRPGHLGHGFGMHLRPQEPGCPESRDACTSVLDEMSSLHKILGQRSMGNSWQKV